MITECRSPSDPRTLGGARLAGPGRARTRLASRPGVQVSTFGRDPGERYASAVSTPGGMTPPILFSETSLIFTTSLLVPYGAMLLRVMPPGPSMAFSSSESFSSTPTRSSALSYWPGRGPGRRLQVHSRPEPLGVNKSHTPCASGPLLLPTPTSGIPEIDFFRYIHSIYMSYDNLVQTIDIYLACTCQKKHDVI